MRKTKKVHKKKRQNLKTSIPYQIVNPKIALYQDIHILPILNWMYFDLYYTLYQASSRLVHGTYEQNIIDVIQLATTLSLIESYDERQDFFKKNFITHTYNLFEGQEKQEYYLLLSFACLQNTSINLASQEELFHLSMNSGISITRMEAELSIARMRLIKQAANQFPTNKLFASESNELIEQAKKLQREYQLMPDTLEKKADFDRYDELAVSLLDELIREKEYINTSPNHPFKEDVPPFEKNYLKHIFSLAKEMGYIKVKDLADISFFEFWLRYEEMQEEYEAHLRKQGKEVGY